MTEFKRIIHMCLKAVCGNFIEFGQSTVLSGFNYISNRSLSFFERFYFFVSFATIFAALITLTTNIYAKWESTPIIVGMTPHPILIRRFPFPAVTICNVNQARNSQVRNFSRDSIEYSMLQTLCRRSVDNVDPSKLAHIQNRTKFRRFIAESSQPCDRLFISCKFGSISKNCMDIFKPVLTDEGQCCVFNSIHASFTNRDQREYKSFINLDGAVAVDWDLEYGYKKHLPNLFYPRVASDGLPGTGISMGLSIIINAEVDDYYCSSRNGPGFKLLLHNPIETPLLRDRGLFFAAGSEISFRIRADRSEASNNIRSFSIDDRQCVFKSERQLTYFKTYTKQNCEMECLANITAKLCGCCPYFLPRIPTNVSICGLKDRPCTLPLQYWTPETTLKINVKDCKDMCMHGCFDLSFTPVAFSIPLTSGGYMIKEQILEKYNTSYLKENVAVVHFFYKLSHFDGFMRTRYVGTTEFMSATGGLFGLVGFSFIAVAEIVYFWILKPFKQLGVLMKDFYRNGRNKRRENKKEEPTRKDALTKDGDTSRVNDLVNLNQRTLDHRVSHRS